MGKIDCLTIGLCNKVEFCKENICERAETVEGDVRRNPRDVLWDRIQMKAKFVGVQRSQLSEMFDQYFKMCTVCGKPVLPGLSVCSQECMQDVYCNET